MIYHWKIVDLEWVFNMAIFRDAYLFGSPPEDGFWLIYLSIQVFRLTCFIHILAAKTPAFEVVILTCSEHVRKYEVCRVEPSDEMNIPGGVLDSDWFRSQGARFQEAYDLAEVRSWKSWKMLTVTQEERLSNIGILFCLWTPETLTFLRVFLSNVLT